MPPGLLFGGLFISSPPSSPTHYNTPQTPFVTPQKAIFHLQKVSSYVRYNDLTTYDTTTLLRTIQRPYYVRCNDPTTYDATTLLRTYKCSNTKKTRPVITTKRAKLYIIKITKYFVFYSHVTSGKRLLNWNLVRIDDVNPNSLITSPSLTPKAHASFVAP